MSLKKSIFQKLKNRFRINFIPVRPPGKLSSNRHSSKLTCLMRYLQQGEKDGHQVSWMDKGKIQCSKADTLVKDHEKEFFPGFE